jgi:hypothetical protein
MIFNFWSGISNLKISQKAMERKFENLQSGVEKIAEVQEAQGKDICEIKDTLLLILNKLE